MAISSILRKMFTGQRENAVEHFDEDGRPIVKMTIEERLLQKHLERERMKEVRKQLHYYDKKHYREMTSLQMPYHNKFKRRRRL